MSTTMILRVLVVEVKGPAAIIKNKASGIALLMTAPMMSATVGKKEVAGIVIMKRTKEEKTGGESILEVGSRKRNTYHTEGLQIISFTFVL